MTPPPQESVTYRSDLEHGHSRECKTLRVAQHPDLRSDIEATAASVRDGLYGLMETDVNFADRATAVIESLNLGRTDYQQLLATLSHVQSLLRSSKLGEEERMAFWAPIAECYARVQATLKDRIVPLEKRELVQLDKTVNIPVHVSFDSRYIIGFNVTTALPPLKYALERINHDNPSHRYREALGSMSFRDGYLGQLPIEVRNRLRAGAMELPVKVVSESNGTLTFIEIDIPAFLASQE